MILHTLSPGNPDEQQPWGEEHACEANSFKAGSLPSCISTQVVSSPRPPAEVPHSFCSLHRPERKQQCTD